ncbi:IclR family transcriptional regulator [Tessaracoccus sp. Z1128]
MKKPLRLLGNARRLLDTIADEGPMTTGHLAEALEMPRSTVFRLAEGLAAIDLVTIRANGTIDIASRWLSLADTALEARTEWQPARRILRELAELTECTSVLCVYQNRTPMCLDWVPGKLNEVLLAQPGRQVPLHAGAEGRSILSSLDPEDLQAVLSQAPFEAFTPSTMISSEELQGDVARSRRQGYTVSLDDTILGLGSISVVVRDNVRGQLGSIAVSSFSDEILRRSEELGQALMRAAAQHEQMTNEVDPA